MASMKDGEEFRDRAGNVVTARGAQTVYGLRRNERDITNNHEAYLVPRYPTWYLEWPAEQAPTWLAYLPLRGLADVDALQSLLNLAELEMLTGADTNAARPEPLASVRDGFVAR
ncbi:MAG: hypothetical protein ACR2HN_09090 [Tepidiformaceae bacterium]